MNHPELGLEHVGPIVDYLHNQRFVAQEVFVEEGDISPDPPQPNLSMKGRTPRSLLRQVGEWHAWLKQQRVRSFRWGPSGIGEFCWVESEEGRPDSRCWTIRELLTSGAIIREGAAMRHCVATFARACARRECSIWSMRYEVAGRRHRALTIEVDPKTRTIWQAPSASRRDADGDAAAHPRAMGEAGGIEDRVLNSDWRARRAAPHRGSAHFALVLDSDPRSYSSTQPSASIR